MNQHNCIKCNAQYQDADPDAYYCPPCLKAKKQIAAQVDAQFASRPRTKVKTMLEQYDEAPKVRGFVHASKFL